MLHYLSSPEPIEIFLQPGDFYFGDAQTRIRTLLGSCVAVTLWHPRLHVGGMCHYMLPHAGSAAGGAPDGRYAGGALALFERELLALGTPPGEYQVKLFGGGRMYTVSGRRGEVLTIGHRNIEAGQRLLAARGFQVSARHLAGEGHRNVVFEVGSGRVWVRHVQDGLHSGPVSQCREMHG